MKFAAVGDALIQRRIPENYEGFEGIKEWLSGAEARLFNLETTIHREGECYGNSVCGGSYLRANPEVLDDCKRYGFNMTTWCNNHTMDFCCEGVAKTYDYVEASGLIHAGSGKNLDQAAAPAYLDAVGGRVALIGFTSSVNSFYNDVGIAGRQSRRVPGRPGVNQLRIKTTMVITHEQMEQIKAIAEACEANVALEISRSEGYKAALPAGIFDFGKHLHFREGETPYQETKCDPRDLARLDQAIHEAKLVSDYILVSVHSHELAGKSKEQPAMFMEEFARHAIDMGADAVIGHGPHLLRPLEIYKGKPIFYSLGDFILQNENIPFMPEDYYESQGLTSDATMHDVFAKRSRNFTIGLQTKQVMFETVIPRWEIVDGKMTSLELLAVELGFGKGRAQGGVPAPAKDGSILERYAKMSEAYGTKMEISGNQARVVLS